MTDVHPSQFPASGHAGGGELRLPRPPGVIRRFWARHRRASDTILAAVVGLAAVSGAVRSGHRAGEASWLTVVAVMLIVISVTGIYVRRTRPLATVLLCSAPILALLWAPVDMVLLPAVVAVYSVAAYRSARTGAVAAAAVWAAAIIAVTLGELSLDPVLESHGFDAYQRNELSSGSAVLAFATQLGVLVALALAIGITIGNRRRYLAALIDLARQLAAERDQQGQLATAMERARIAREMHDIVSHSLTVMVALAEGSSVAAEQAAPDAATTMRTVADTGRSAMVDMRRMLGVLGGDGSTETAPQPGFDDLPELIDRFRAIEMPVGFRCDEPAPADPAVQLTVYRLVQEALTNALRYSHGPTEVMVSVAIHHGTLLVSVVDDGLAGFAAVKVTTNGEIAGSGRGLIGLRERLASIGGTLTAGPRTDGAGWRVLATIPLDDETEGGPA